MSQVRLGLKRDWKVSTPSFACIFSLMVLKVLGQLLTSLPQAITQTTGCFVSFPKKDLVTGLEVILQSSSHIFQVTWLAFSLRKCKFIVWIIARTHTAKVFTECCWFLGSILVNEFSETSFFWTSSKNAYRWKTGRMGSEQNRTDREWIWNGYRTGREGIQNRNGNACGTATERVLSSVPC